MVRLEKFDWTELEKELTNREYTMLYMDYNRENGVRFVENMSELTDEDRKNFYKMLIFNDDFMITVYNLGEESRYSRIEREDFAEPMIKEFYTTLGKKLAVRVGKTSDGTEIFQYTEFVGGER